MRAKFLILFSLLSWCATGHTDQGCASDITGISQLFLLPPKSERYLIAVGVMMPDKKRFAGFADYVGSHQMITSKIGLWRWENGQRENIETPVEYFYGGEILIRNQTSEAAFGKIEQMNVTSSLFKGLTSTHPRQTRNSPIDFLEFLSVNWLVLVGVKPVVTSEFDPKHPHLNGVDLGSSRHTFVNELAMLGGMAKELAPLPDSFRRNGDGEISKTSDAMARIEWMIPHLKRYSNLSNGSANEVVGTLRRWRENGVITRETSDQLRKDLNTIWHSYNNLRDQIHVIEL